MTVQQHLAAFLSATSTEFPASEDGDEASEADEDVGELFSPGFKGGCGVSGATSSATAISGGKVRSAWGLGSNSAACFFAAWAAFFRAFVEWQHSVVVTQG